MNSIKSEISNELIDLFSEEIKTNPKLKNNLLKMTENWFKYKIDDNIINPDIKEVEEDFIYDLNNMMINWEYPQNFRCYPIDFGEFQKKI